MDIVCLAWRLIAMQGVLARRPLTFRDLLAESVGSCVRLLPSTTPPLVSWLHIDLSGDERKKKEYPLINSPPIELLCMRVGPGARAHVLWGRLVPPSVWSLQYSSPARAHLHVGVGVVDQWEGATHYIRSKMECGTRDKDRRPTEGRASHPQWQKRSKRDKQLSDRESQLLRFLKVRTAHHSAARVYQSLQSSQKHPRQPSRQLATIHPKVRLMSVRVW